MGIPIMLSDILGYGHGIEWSDDRVRLPLLLFLPAHITSLLLPSILLSQHFGQLFDRYRSDTLRWMKHILRERRIF